MTVLAKWAKARERRAYLSKRENTRRTATEVESTTDDGPIGLVAVQRID